MVCKRLMPKAMSDWFDERIKSGQCKRVPHGFVMKSRNCAIAFFPSWNCDEQFEGIVKKLKRY